MSGESETVFGEVGEVTLLHSFVPVWMDGVTVVLLERERMADELVL